MSVNRRLVAWFNVRCIEICLLTYLLEASHARQTNTYGNLMKLKFLKLESEIFRIVYHHHHHHLFAHKTQTRQNAINIKQSDV